MCRNGALAIYTYIHAAVICHVSHLGSWLNTYMYESANFPSRHLVKIHLTVHILFLSSSKISRKMARKKKNMRDSTNLGGLNVIRPCYMFVIGLVLQSLPFWTGKNHFVLLWGPSFLSFTTWLRDHFSRTLDDLRPRLTKNHYESQRNGTCPPTDPSYTPPKTNSF